MSNNYSALTGMPTMNSYWHEGIVIKHQALFLMSQNCFITELEGGVALMNSDNNSNKGLMLKFILDRQVFLFCFFALHFCDPKK